MNAKTGTSATLMHKRSAFVIVASGTDYRNSLSVRIPVRNGRSSSLLLGKVVRDACSSMMPPVRFLARSGRFGRQGRAPIRHGSESE
jgi:hypothetical protein